MYEPDAARLEPLESEFVDLAIRRIQAGDWPWSFFCYPEERPRPVFPSFFRLLAPSAPDGTIAVLCPSCFHISINLVTHEHVDLPFHNDAEIGVQHVFTSDITQTLDEFRARLYSADFDARRLQLE
jgi:hypothetical protein